MHLQYLCIFQYCTTTLIMYLPNPKLWKLISDASLVFHALHQNELILKNLVKTYEQVAR